MLEDVALAGAEPAADQHSPSRFAAGPGADGIEQLRETVLHRRLVRAEHGNRVAVRHPCAQCFQRPPVRQRHALHGRPVHADPNRTNDE